MKEFAFRLITSRWRKTIDAVLRFGGTADVLIVEPPAAAGKIRELEGALGAALPHAYRDAFALSRKVECRWRLPKQFALPDQFRGIFGGDCSWSIDRTLELDNYRRASAQTVFMNLADPYDAVWHQKLAFHDVGNGDYLALDLAPQSHGSVVYLSHDDGEGHGLRLAADFTDFIDRWSRLGCVGAEDWQWLPFYDKTERYLNPDCANAVAFRKTLGLEF